MKSRSLFLAALLLAADAVQAQTPVDAPAPLVQFGLFMIQPDGSVGGSATQIGQQAGADLSRTFYLGTCSYGAGPVPASATDVWQLSGKVLALTAEEASMQIGWQRLRRGGQDESSSPQSTHTLTLKSGERMTLERNALPPGSCGEGHVSLEIAFAIRSDRGRESAGERAAERIRELREQLEQVNRPVANASVGTADLWLVRSAAGHPDETLHMKASYGLESQPFAFVPMIIKTSNGDLRVKVEGALGVDARRLRLNFSASRGVTFVPSNRPPRDSAPLVEGSTNTTVQLPKPDEVLSFEMPPLRVPGGAALPDRISIRVRLTPAAGVKKK